MPNQSQHRKLRSSLKAMTLGPVQAKAKRDAALAPLDDGNFLQHIQLQLDGEATSAITTTTADVSWEIPFLLVNDPVKAGTTSASPHFTSGIECSTDTHVVIDVQVVSWAQNESGWFTGATVRAMAYSPDAVKKTPFSATVHLCFIGYGAPSADESDG